MSAHLEYYIWRTSIVAPTKVHTLPDFIWERLRSRGLLQIRPKR